MDKIRKIINEEIKKVINETNFLQPEEKLVELSEKNLEIAHKALNNLMMSLFVNSQSDFAKKVFNFVKQADDMILLARKELP